VQRFDVAIVGGGPMGTAAARALGARGRSVVLFERFTVGHANGSSAGTTRNFRLTYHDPIYVRMARLALERWRALEDEAGEELLRTVGELDVGVPTDAEPSALAAAGERFERPSEREAADRWPMLRFPAGSTFLYQEDAAVIRSRAAILAQARIAGSLGADVREHRRVTSVRPEGDDVRVVTAEGDEVRAPAAIVAAGAWTRGLVRPLGIELPLRPTIEQSTYFDADVTGVPTVIDWAASPAAPPYLVPDPFEGGCKAGGHRTGAVVDPDAGPFEPDGEREAGVAGWVSSRLATPARLLRSEPCLYTNAPDEDFVIDRIGPLVVASPCSGHGFKFAPLVGDVLADLVTGSEPPVPLDRFRVDRPALVAVG
jgi:sarcosine oxidase